MIQPVVDPRTVTLVQSYFVVFKNRTVNFDNAVKVVAMSGNELSFYIINECCLR